MKRSNTISWPDGERGGHGDDMRMVVVDGKDGRRD